MVVGNCLQEEKPRVPPHKANAKDSKSMGRNSLLLMQSSTQTQGRQEIHKEKLSTNKTFLCLIVGTVYQTYIWYNNKSQNIDVKLTNVENTIISFYIKPIYQRKNIKKTHYQNH